MATIYNPFSRNAVWLRSLGYSPRGHKQRGMCVDVWWQDPFGRSGPVGTTYTQGYVVAAEREKRRIEKQAKAEKPHGANVVKQAAKRGLGS